MKKVVTALTVLIFFFSLTARSQTKMTLQECVKVALDNNLTVKRSVYNAETFKVNLLASKAAFLPTFSANTSFGYNTGRSINPVTNTFITRETETVNASLNSSLLLFNGLRLQNSFRQNVRDSRAANFDLERVKNDVTINVVVYYVTVILNKELYENAKLQLTSSQQQLENVKKQVAAGSLPRSSELDQDATVATNELSLINQENALNLSLLQLKQSMQVPASTQFDVVVPDLALEDLTVPQTAEEIYAISLETLPQIKSALLKVESSQYALKASKGNFYPRVTLSGSGTSNYSSASNPNVLGEHYGVASQLNDNIYKSFNLGVNIPILNGLQTRTAVQRATINRAVADITLKEAENTLRQTIETSYNDAVSAAKSYAASAKQLASTEEAYRMSKQRFDNGASSYVDFIVSENNFYRSRSNLAQAKYTFILRKKVLDFYQGKPIEY
jgi:outer membrane protein